MNVNYGYTAVSGGASVVETDPIAVHPYTTQAKTANFTAAAGNVYLVDTTGGTVTATLPAANVAGQSLAVKLVAGTNPVAVVRAGSDTIGAAATTANITLDNEVWEFTSSGSGQWNLTAGNKTLASLDGRFTQRASNLSDLGSAATSRTNLGLGGASTLAVGTTAGTVAAGDDSRVTGAAQKASNLSDLASASTSRTNLGLAGAAVLAVGTTAGTVAAGDDPRILAVASNSDSLDIGQFVPHLDACGSNTIAITSGTLVLSYFTADKTETIATITAYTGTVAAAATPTLCRMGIYSVATNGDITLVASTPNDTTLFAGTSTAYAKALSVSLSKTAGSRYATGLLVVTGTTTPNFQGVQMVATSVMATLQRVGPASTGRVASQTDLPPSMVAASITGGQSKPLIRLS